MNDREHSFPNGTVSVKMHKRKRLTLVVAREDLEAGLIERIEELEHENRVLRRKVTALTEAARFDQEVWSAEHDMWPEVDPPTNQEGAMK